MDTNFRRHNPACSPREFVDALDALVCCRINIHRECQLAIPDRKYVAAQEEEAELLLRQLTDYLLVNSKEVGLAVHGDHR